jgi:hypothetical protein
MAQENQLFAVAALALLLLPGGLTAGWFGKDSGWTSEEKSNFCHFLNSQQAYGTATRIQNSTGDFATEQEVSQMLSNWRDSLREASQVSDAVLDKVNPSLSAKFRSMYEQGLKYKIAAFEQQNTSFAITGSKMISDFIDWFQTAEYRVPKGTAAACK